MSHIVTLGNLCIGLSIFFALFGMIAFFAGRRLSSETAAMLGRASVYATFILMTVANLAMINALLTNDFAVSYVAQVGAREMPRWISIVSLWSSLEGSILFWGWVLTAYSAVCIYLYREFKDPTFARMMLWVGLTLLFVQVFFFLLLALPANPFLPVNPVPENGPGPNPLLQNHWLMAVHPPCLYVGYIGFTIPFAFAIAALLEKDLPGHWIALTRRWMLFSWSFLSMAIVLGGWWSYAVLGWGGYWAWDPVENASFMPWLSATALIHSIMVQEKRRMLPVWNLFLAILTFLLTLLGTFLTRSGVLDSVHSFTESHVGPYFLVFIGIILAISLALLLWASPKLRQPGRFENLLSLEFLFLFNNLLFLSFCFVVFLGTLYPLIVEALQGKRISVGEPYFDQMTVPIVGMILLLMSVGLVTPWRRGTWQGILKASQLPCLLAGVVTLLTVILGIRHFSVVIMTLLASFAFFVMAVEVVKLSRKRSPFHLLLDNSRRYGGFIAHTGALMIIVAVAFSSSYEREQEVTLPQGQVVAIENYELKLQELQAEQAPQRFEVRAVVEVLRQGKPVTTLNPQMNFYPVSQQPIGSPAIRSTLVSDLYLTLIHFEKDGSKAALRVIQAPAVAWIWIGGLVTMAGGLSSLVFGASGAPLEKSRRR